MSGGLQFTGFGSCSCCCPPIKICLKCGSDPVVGATITVSKTGFSTSGVTGADGCVTLTIPSSGRYEIAASGGSPVCINPVDVTMQINCGSHINLQCCECSAQICVVGCPAGTPLGGATVTVDDLPPCVTVVSGGVACCSFQIPAPGSYPVTVSAPGFITYNGNLQLDCGSSQTIQLKPVGTSADICFIVGGCGCDGVGGPTVLPGAQVSLGDQGGMTAADGHICFTIAITTLGTYGWSIQKDRFQPASGTYTIGGDPTCPVLTNFTCNDPNTCFACVPNFITGECLSCFILYGSTGLCVSVNLQPDPTYICSVAYPDPNNPGNCSWFADPVPFNLFLNDSRWGACTLTYTDNPLGFGGQGWAGSIPGLQYQGSNVLATCTPTGPCPPASFDAAYILWRCGQGFGIGIFCTVAPWCFADVGGICDFCGGCPSNEAFPTCRGHTGNIIFCCSVSLSPIRTINCADYLTAVCPPLFIEGVVPCGLGPILCTCSPWQGGEIITISE